MTSARYIRHFLGAMGAYCFAVVLMVMGLKAVADTSPVRYGLVLLPMVPVAYGIRQFMEAVRYMDELQRRIQFEAMAFSFGLTAFISLTLGFLENANGPRLGMIWVFPLMIGLWGVGQALSNRRYQ